MGRVANIIPDGQYNGGKGHMRKYLWMIPVVFLVVPLCGSAADNISSSGTQVTAINSVVVGGVTYDVTFGDRDDTTFASDEKGARAMLAQLVKDLNTTKYTSVGGYSGFAINVGRMLTIGAEAEGPGTWVVEDNACDPGSYECPNGWAEFTKEAAPPAKP
jgi:hypothetical protein